ncbi:zinc-ribbon domain-containing protein [Lactobacillus delbrueckii subsp. bulgaricus]|nr:hypothetical protein [Lactobacillus delbrueckii subsp. bulgaricus]
MDNQSNVTPPNYNTQYKFCQNCGAKIDVKAVLCPKCGVPVNASEDRNNGWWNLVGFFFPIIGWVLWGVWHKEYPKRAHGICVWSWVGFAIGFTIGFVNGFLSSI